MVGEIPSEIGNLEALQNLDISKFLIMKVKFISPKKKSLIDTFFPIGDYAVSQSTGKTATIPTELGKLKNWKFVVFCKFFVIFS